MAQDVELLHRRIARTLTEQIEGGDLRPGDKLPSESELTDRFTVSRATVRRALRDLAADGLVHAEPGRGSFVAGSPLSEAPNALMSFTELGAARGLRASARVLGTRVTAADLDEAEQLGVAPGTDVFVLERLRRLDGQAIGVDVTRVPLFLAPALADADFRTASLYAVLAEAGHEPAQAAYSVQAVAADARHATFLGVDRGFPLLVTVTTSRDRAGVVVERGQMTYRGDRYRFRATLARRSR